MPAFYVHVSIIKSNLSARYIRLHLKNWKSGLFGSIISRLPTCHHCKYEVQQVCVKLIKCDRLYYQFHATFFFILRKHRGTHGKSEINIFFFIQQRAKWIKYLFIYLIYLFIYYLLTHQPVYRDHKREKEKLAFVYRWSLFRGYVSVIHRTNKQIMEDSRGLWM